MVLSFIPSYVLLKSQRIGGRKIESLRENIRMLLTLKMKISNSMHFGLFMSCHNFIFCSIDTLPCIVLIISSEDKNFAVPHNKIQKGPKKTNLSRDVS